MTTLPTHSHRRLTAAALSVTLSLGAPGAQAQDVGALLGPVNSIMGMLSGMLTQGGLTSMISMIPGLNFLAGLGPIMDIVKMIPGLDGLLSSIPGLSQILGLLGMGGANMGPLNTHITNLVKWVKTAQDLFQGGRNLLSSNNYADAVGNINSLMRLAKTGYTLRASDFKANPQGAAQSAINSLGAQQQRILSAIAGVKTQGEAAALREVAETLEGARARVQTTADNTETMQRNDTLAKKTEEQVLDSLNYTTEAARAIKDAKKTEDITKLAAAAQIQAIKNEALSSAALTSALANMTKVQVTQSETLGQILSEMQTDRMRKAQAILSMMNEIRMQHELRNEEARRQASSMGGTLTGAFRGGRDILGE